MMLSLSGSLITNVVYAGAFTCPTVRAHPEDLADLARRLHPKAVVPIHTEAASQFAAFIQNVRVVNDGEAVEVGALISDFDGEAT